MAHGQNRHTKHTTTATNCRIAIENAVLAINTAIYIAIHIATFYIIKFVQYVLRFCPNVWMEGVSLSSVGSSRYCKGSGVDDFSSSLH